MELVDIADLKSVGSMPWGFKSPWSYSCVNSNRKSTQSNVMAVFRYTITRKHVFVDNEPVLMYYIENIPFAFDILEDHEKHDKWILSEAALNQEYTLEDIFRYSDYLIAEECHPVLFELDLVNPEVLPDEPVS